MDTQTIDLVWETYKRLGYSAKTARELCISPKSVDTVLKKDPERKKQIQQERMARSAELEKARDRKATSPSLHQPKEGEIMLDGRYRIHPNDHHLVRDLYAVLKSQRQVAATFGISRRLVAFICDPKRYEDHKEHNKEIEHWKLYYDKDQWKKTMRKFRAKKRSLGYTRGRTVLPYNKPNTNE